MKIYPMKCMLTYKTRCVFDDNMASVMWKSRVPTVSQLVKLQQHGIATSSCAWKNIRAGVQKRTNNHSKTLTYEEAQAPYQIGVTKSWNSWNTCNLKGEGRKAETTIEDVYIRRFMVGTWPGILASEMIIKRRYNMIFIAGLVTRSFPAQKIYFLLGYTEELLAHILKCPIKLEIQTVEDKKDVIFKYI